MAKVKSAKDKITVFLKAKGLDASEIRDAFDELDAADADLGQLADALQKNEAWSNFWYNQAAPEVQKIAQERDTYKVRLEKLQAAGLSFEEAKAVANENTSASGQANYVTAESLEQFKQNLASASSDVMKDLIKLNFKHFKEFNSEADLDAIEALMQPDPTTGRRKASTVNEAYRLWSEPAYDKKRSEEIERKIADGIKKGVQDELSKSGVPVRRRKSPAEELGVEVAPLDKPAPSDHELRNAFLADLNEEVTH